MDKDELREKIFAIVMKNNESQQKYYQIKKFKFTAWDGAKKNEML